MSQSVTKLRKKKDRFALGIVFAVVEYKECKVRICTKLIKF